MKISKKVTRDTKVARDIFENRNVTGYFLCHGEKKNTVKGGGSTYFFRCVVFGQPLKQRCRIFFSLEKILKALTHSFSWVAVFFFFRHNFLTILAKIMGIFLFPPKINSFYRNKAVFFYFRLRSSILAKI